LKVFHFVDEILECEPGRRALGIKHVTPWDSFVRITSAGGRELLPCIVGEALGQLGAWCAMAANGFTLRPVAGVVGEVGIFGPAGPGDSILLSTTIDSLTDEAVYYHASASVDGEEILTLGNTLGPLLPLEDFDDPDQLRARFDAISRTGSRPEPPPALEPATPVELGFDELLSCEPGRELRAVKTISADEPYFGDHFPRKPVLPLSLLLESLLQLGQRLLSDEGAELEQCRFAPKRLRKVKMRRFVEAGQMLEATARVEESDTRAARLSFSCSVDGGRTCVAQADYSAATGESR
jgi:3-hydroxymyristoyl/3-hydroxydecanoyl-(acyl carrier protein) dehydratase